MSRQEAGQSWTRGRRERSHESQEQGREEGPHTLAQRAMKVRGENPG